MKHSKFKSGLLASVMASAGLLSGCGGGAGETLLISQALSVAGLISGLGSVVVNGVRYETIGATVLDADDHHNINAPLGLGMTISLEPNSTHPTAAGTIHVQSGIKGFASAVDLVSKTLNVAGLPITTDSSTIVILANGAVGSLANVGNNSVEVYGLPQTDGTFKATRIEIETSSSFVQLVGVISNLNTANTTFNLGSGIQSVSINFNAASVPTGLANGAVVSIRTNAQSNANAYAATAVYVRSSNATVFNDYVNNYAGTTGMKNEANELYGMVTNLSSTSTGCTLQVQGIPTTLTSTTLCSALQNGDYVEVKGQLSNGSLAAYRVEFKTAGGERNLTGYQDDQNDDDHDNLKFSRITTTASSSSSGNSSAERSTSYEIYGTLSNCVTTTCSLNTNGTNMTIDLSTAIWEHGRVITSGLVEAKGYMAATNVFKVIKIEDKRG
ncbi:MAG: hypothetical protein RJB45_2005 [Pseudomonadota bacterium]|jgi:hypothetical protein